MLDEIHKSIMVSLVNFPSKFIQNYLRLEDSLPLPEIDLVMINSFLNLTQNSKKEFALTFYSNLSIASDNLYK